MNINLDITELKELALDRDINVRSLIHDYLDEVIDAEPEILWNLEQDLSASIMRCVKCGYWVPSTKIVGEVCEDCGEE